VNSALRRRQLDEGVLQLHHPCPGKAEVVLTSAAHDDVVQHADADVLQGLDDLVSGVDVLLGGIALSAGMIVHKNDAARMADTGLANDVSRIHDAGADTATAHFDVLDDLIADVQQDNVEELLAGARSCGVKRSQT